MARLRFLAQAYDLRPGKETTVYGAGHETDFDESDYEYAIQLRNRGYAEIIDATGLPAGPSEETAREPFVASPPAQA
jgi:hypothetical protein